jgi:hypothetical protein
MSSEMVDPSSPPLVPTTPHVPAEFKTQVLRSPLLVRLPHCSISRAEQCEVAFYRRLHSVPLKIERPVQARLRVSEATTPLAAQARCSQQPDRCPPKILQRVEACTTACVRVRYLPPPRSEQLPSSLPQLVALVRSPNISVSSRVRLRQSPLASSVARRSAQDIQHPRLVARSYWAKISAVQVFPRVPQVCADLVAQSPHAQGLVGHSYNIAKRASTCRSQTTRIHVHFPLPQIMLFLLRTFPQSAAFARGFRSANPTQRQYQRAPSRTGVLRSAPRNHSRWSVLPDRQIVLRIRAAFLAQHGSKSLLQRAGTEDSPYLSWEEMMRRRRGSTHGYAHSEDLETGVRRSEATDHRADGVTTRALQPPLRLILSFRWPRAFSACSDRPETRQERRAQVIRHTHSESERVVARIALNNTKTTLVVFKSLTARADISELYKQLPRVGLVLVRRPCHVGGRPTSCVALQGPGVGARGTECVDRPPRAEAFKMG